MKMIIYQPNDRLLLKLFGVTAITVRFVPGSPAETGMPIAKVFFHVTRPDLTDGEVEAMRQWATERFGVEPGHVDLYHESNVQ